MEKESLTCHISPNDKILDCIAVHVKNYDKMTGVKFYSTAGLQRAGRKNVVGGCPLVISTLVLFSRFQRLSDYSKAIRLRLL